MPVAIARKGKLVYYSQTAVDPSGDCTILVRRSLRALSRTAFVVARRRKEMGLRLALGADPGHVVWLVMKEVLVLLGLGLAVGVPAAVGLGRLASSQLYGIQPDDPRLAIATMALLGCVSTAAGFIPAHRASRIDPNLALRCE